MGGPALAVLGGLLLAALGAAGVLASDAPELSLDALDPWLVVYAVGPLVALGGLPFVLRARMGGGEEREGRWERAVTAWGGIAIAAALAFLLLGAGEGFDRDTAGGVLAIAGLGACGLVVAVVVGTIALG